MRGHVEAKDQDALYYPYIHFRDPEWVKRTLLIFPHLVRMVPANFVPRDRFEIFEYLRAEGRRGPLIRNANMDTTGVLSAQKALKQRIEKDLNTNPRVFLRRYGAEAAARSRKPGSFGFQMHEGKVVSELLEWLKEKRLAWVPGDPEFAGYVEVHPTLGSAIMSTLAIACAQDDGLEIVADPSDGQLHRCVAEQRMEDVYDTWLNWRRKKKPELVLKEAEPTGECLLEVIVFQYADVSRVTPSALAELNEEWEALAALRAALQKLAGYIPVAVNPGRLQEYLEDKAATAIREWESNKANMASFKRKFFDVNVFKPEEAFMKKLTEKALIAEGMTVAGPPLIAGLTSGSVLAAGAGLGIGLLFHALSSWQKIKSSERDSPYRYLTMMEKAGVVFTLSSQQRLAI